MAIRDLAVDRGMVLPGFNPANPGNMKYPQGLNSLFYNA